MVPMENQAMPEAGHAGRPVVIVKEAQTARLIA